MSPSGGVASGNGRPRYYTSSVVLPALDAPERVPANRLDSSVVAILRRMRLLGRHWHHDDLLAILRRVVVLEDAIVLHLDRRLCLSTWRAHEPILQRITAGDVLRLVSTCLSKGEEITEAGTTLCLKAPRHSRARKIRDRGPRAALLFKRTN